METDGLQVDIVCGALGEDIVSNAEVTDVVVVGPVDGVAVNFGVTSVCNNSILTSRDEMLMRLRVLLFDNIQLTYPDVEGVVVGWLPPGQAESLAGDGSCGRKQYLYLFSFKLCLSIFLLNSELNTLFCLTTMVRLIKSFSHPF